MLWANVKPVTLGGGGQGRPQSQEQNKIYSCGFRFWAEILENLKKTLNKPQTHEPRPQPETVDSLNVFLSNIAESLPERAGAASGAEEQENL